MRHDYEQKFANLPDHRQWIKLCSNAGIAKTEARIQYFTTFDDAELDKLGGILFFEALFIKNKRMDPWEHEDRSSFGGGRQSSSRTLRNRDHDTILIWVMIVNGINKYVTEMTEETQKDHTDYIGDSTGKLVAESRPKRTSIPTTPSPTVTLPYHQRDWIDVEPGPHDKSCFEVSKKMIRLLRHGPSVLREEHGAVEFRILAPTFRSEFTSSQHFGLFEHGLN